MRQFVASSETDSSGILEITGKDFRYMRQVLRLCPGDMVSVSMPSGRQLQMTVCTADDKSKKLLLQQCDSGEIPETDIQPEPDTFYVLFQFIPKPQKMEVIVRQAVECGVSVIIPVIGDYTQSGSEKSLMEKSSSGSSGRNDRYSRIIREARQQSGSPVDTKLLAPVKLDEAVSYWKELVSGTEDPSVAIVLYERRDGVIEMKDVVAECAGNKIKYAAVFVGSEGGVSPDEISYLMENGFKAVHFKTNILRCETAALYGMAALQTAITNFMR